MGWRPEGLWAESAVWGFECENLHVCVCVCLFFVGVCGWVRGRILGFTGVGSYVPISM